MDAIISHLVIAIDVTQKWTDRQHILILSGHHEVVDVCLLFGDVVFVRLSGLRHYGAECTTDCTHR